MRISTKQSGLLRVVVLASVLSSLTCGPNSKEDCYQGSADQVPREYSIHLSSPALLKLWQGRQGKVLVVVGEEGTIVRSEDNGKSWSGIRSGVDVKLSGIIGDPEGKVLVAVGVNGSITHSTDVGRSWSRVDSDTDADLAAVIGDLENKVLVAVGEGGAIVRSEDGGQSWKTVDSPKDADLFAITDGSDDEMLVAVGGDGVIIRSVDAGKSWKQVYSDTSANLHFVISAEKGNVLVAVGSSGTVVRSDDGGQTWKALRSGTKIQLHAVVVGPQGKRLVVAGNNGTIIRSEDAGQNWSVVYSGAYDLGAVAGDPQGTVMVAVGNNGAIARSEDGGKAWYTIHSGDEANLHAVIMDPQSQTFVAAGAGGAIINSKDGGKTWQWNGMGIRPFTLNSVISDPQGKVVVAVGEDGAVVRSDGVGLLGVKSVVDADLDAVIGDSQVNVLVAVGENGTVIRSEDSGKTWKLIKSGTGSYLHALIGDPQRSVLLSVGNQGAIIRSGDGGKTWTSIHSGVKADLIDIIGDPFDTMLLAVGNAGCIVRSENAGLTWNTISSSTTSRLNAISRLAGGNVVVAVGGRGTIVRSTDDGKTWTKMESGISAQLTAVAGNSTGKALVVIGGGGAITRSEDSGQTWEQVDHANKFDLTAVIDDPQGKTLFAVGKHGTIERSEDAGQTWTKLDSGCTADLAAVFGDPRGKALIAVGSRVLRLKQGQKRWPALSSIQCGNDAKGNLSLEITIDDPDKLCTTNCVKILGWKTNSSSSRNDVQPIECELTRKHDKPLVWQASFYPREMLSATPGDYIHLKVELSGNGYSIRYPPETQSIQIQYLVDRTTLYIGLGLLLLALMVLSVYALRPLWLLTVSRRFAVVELFLSQMPGGKVAADVIDKLLIVPWMSSLPRVLDAWLNQEGVKFQSRFEAVGESRSLVFCALPVTRLTPAERIANPSDQTFSTEFSSSRTLIQLVGSGGAGKTSLAIQIVRCGIEGKLLSYRMQPLWIDEDVNEPNKWLVDRVRTIAEDADLPEQFVTALMRKKRLLIVIDRLSERRRETQDAWAKHLPEFARAVVVTLRSNNFTFDSGRSSTYMLETLAAGTLSSFIEHLLRFYDIDAKITRLADRGELLRRLAEAVTVGSVELPVTPLLTKLFVLACLRRLSQVRDGNAWDALPASVPQVYIDFLESVNPTDPGSSNFLRTEDMFMAAKVLAVGELGADYRPKFLSIHDARSILRSAGLPDGNVAGSTDSIQRLIDNQVLRRVERLGSGYVRFELDPVSEYVAAIAHAERCGTSKELWEALIKSVATEELQHSGFAIALSVTHRTHAKDYGWPQVPFPD